MKKFEITKKQLTQLREYTRLIEDWFPEAFKNELEVGKWYVRKNNIEKSLVFKVSKLGYGWFDGMYSEKEYWSIEDVHNWTEATPQEIRTALIAEAEKRYKNACYIECFSSGRQYLKGDTYQYYQDTNDLYSNGCILFRNGNWATIVETITKEEAEKLLNKKII